MKVVPPLEGSNSAMSPLLTPRSVHDVYDKLAKNELSRQLPAAECPQTQFSLSFQQVAQRSYALAAALLEACPLAEAGSGISAQDAHASSGELRKHPRLIGLDIRRTSEHFLPMMVAVSRAQGTCVFPLRPHDWSALTDKERQLNKRRNDQVQAIVRRTVDEDWCARALDAASKNWSSPARTRVTEAQAAVRPGDLFALMFTGGTVKEKIAAVTHGMFVHESKYYSRIVPARSRKSPTIAAATPPTSTSNQSTAQALTAAQQQHKIAINTSVYWAASAIGQLSIAAAIGASAVFIDCKDFDDMRGLITASGTSILGVAPTVADQLYGTQGLVDDTTTALPTVEVLFTWGEPLKQKTLQKVRGASKDVAIRELLIATEYWLCLYRDPNWSTPSFRLVAPELADNCVVVQSRREEEDMIGTTNEPVVRSLRDLSISGALSHSFAGTLHFRGGFVTPGYYDPKIAGIVALEHTTIGELEYFNTKDRVEAVIDGGTTASTVAGGGEDGTTTSVDKEIKLTFLGRDDFRVKINAEMVDLADVKNRMMARFPGVDVELLRFEEEWHQKFKTMYYFFTHLSKDVGLSQLIALKKMVGSVVGETEFCEVGVAGKIRSCRFLMVLLGLGHKIFFCDSQNSPPQKLFTEELSWWGVLGFSVHSF